jgi:Leucine-rich repeat (LRR) protein
LGLKSVNLAFNNISDFSSVELPDHVEILDLSGNPIWNFTAKSLPHLAKLTELYLRVSFLYKKNQHTLSNFSSLSPRL